MLKNIFKRKEIKKGTLLNLIIFFSSLIGLALILINTFILAIKYYSINENQMDLMGISEFEDYSENSFLFLIFGVIMFLAPLLIRIKLKIKNSFFGYAIGIILASSIIASFFSYLEIDVNILIITLFIFSFYIYIHRKNKITSHLQLLGTYASINLIFFSFSIFIVGYFHNQSNYVNHYRLQGQHPVFSSSFEFCNENESKIWFENYFIPIKEPCYFKRYLKEDEILEDHHTKLMSIYYGGMIDYSNFLLLGHHKIFENYTEKEAVLLYQIHFESMKKRHEISNISNIDNANGKELRQKIIEDEQEFYNKSKDLGSKEFIQYLQDKEEKSISTDALLISINTYSKISKKTNNTINYEDLMYYKEKIHNGSKSNLFANSDKKIETEVLTDPEVLFAIYKNRIKVW